MAGLALPFVLVALAAIGVLGLVAGLFSVLVGFVWFLVKWLLAPLALVALLIYLLGRRRRRRSVVIEGERDG